MFKSNAFIREDGKKKYVNLSRTYQKVENVGIDFVHFLLNHKCAIMAVSMVGEKVVARISEILRYLQDIENEENMRIFI